MVNSPGPSEYNPEMERAPLPRWADLLCAAAALTRLPLQRPDPHGDGVGRATLFFPVIGLGVGAVLLVADLSLRSWCPRWVVALALVTVWELMTAGWNPQCVGARLRPATHSARYWLWQGAKLAAAAAAVGRPVAFLFAPLLGCWTIVVLAVGARDADKPGRKFNTAINFREFAITSVVAFAVVFTVAEAAGLLVVLAAAAGTLVLRLLAHRRYGGVRWQFLSAGARAIEVFVLLLFAAA